MRRGGRILVVLGLLLGLVTAAVTFVTLLDSSSKSATQAVSTRPVVVAIQPIPQRGEISPEMVGVVQWPIDAIPAGGVYENTLEVIGKLALFPIYQGQLVVPQMLVGKSPPVVTPTGSLAAFVIPEGKVAMAFSISELTGVAGAIQPGDTVDMLLTLSGSLPPAAGTRPGTQPTAAATGTEGLPVTQIFLQDLLVLHMGTWAAPTDKNAPAGNTITFVVDRQDALALKSAREQGEIELVLRRVGDRKQYDTEPVTLQYLNKRFKFNLVPGATTGR